MLTDYKECEGGGRESAIPGVAGDVYQQRDRPRKCRATPARLVMAALVGVSLMAGQDAQALELFGIHLFGRSAEAMPIVDNPQTYQASLHFVGESDREVEKAVRAASALIRQQRRPPSGTTGLLGRARGDLRRILAALYDKARYGGSISINIGGRPMETLSAAAELPEMVPVDITVSPGPVFAFGSVHIEQAPDFARPELRKTGTPAENGLAVGARARSSAILSAETSLVEGWRQLGHPKAEIGARDVVADHTSRTVDVRIAVRPGPPSAFGAITVSGTERMNPAFVAWRSGLATGERYDPDDIAAARDRLQRLEVFRSVTFAEAAAIDNGFLPIDIAVRERKPRVFGIGAAYSTVDGGQVEAYWAHRNLFGQAESLRIEGMIGGLASTENDTPDYRLAATFTKPGVYTPDTDLTFRAEAFREETDNVVERTARLGAAVNHHFSPTLNGSLGAAIEESEITDAFGTRSFTILSLPMALTLDNRDNPLHPTTGFRAGATLEPFTDIRSGIAAVRGTASASAYRSLDANDRVILAGRGMIGSVAGAGLSALPENRRFFAGGGGSVRGYGHRTIGVPGPGGTVVGGRSAIEGSLELRARVTDAIGIVPFIDAGGVSPNPDLSGLGDVKVGTGVGIRFHTPLGPIRADVAVPLNPGPDDPAWGLYVGIGQAF